MRTGKYSFTKKALINRNIISNPLCVTVMEKSVTEITLQLFSYGQIRITI